MRRHQLKQALINLLANAIKASAEGETVSIIYFQKRANLVLEVIDRGCGIPPQKKQEI